MLSWQRTLWFVIASTLISIGIWHWLHLARETTHLLDRHSLEQSPNFIVRDLQYRQYDMQGKLTHHLSAPIMHHIPKNDMHIFTQPHLYVTENNESPWEIYADYGTAISKGQSIVLDQNVQINQHKPNEETILKTEHLIYYPQQKKATSSDDVTIAQGDSHIHSHGLIADLANNHIHLVNARGRHVQKTT